MGNLESPMTGNFKKYLEGSRKGARPFMGALLRGFLYGYLEGHGEEDSGDGHHSPWGRRWGS